MKPLFFATVFLLIGTFHAFAQTPQPWTDEDRKYLITHLEKTRDALIKETTGLTPAQWNFKESPDRWSIKEVVEHIDLWELLLQREINLALSWGSKPELAQAAQTDSMKLAFIMEEKPHISVEYTKPFTFTVPMGLTDGKTNLAWFLKMRNESIGYVSTTKDDLRSFFMRAGRGSVHQVYITSFGHTARHLRQIQKIKQHQNWPK